ncbi:MULTISPECIES: hypothetical protein [unclassified Solwaraspora]|nr:MULTISPECIES: hypothetical protein [unclassified Solwaraspora]WBB97769.1 hypothetical protein O7553_01985 [Solwaraspora sp. WMMA2059]WBC18341.1 hypothetical protein O7543_15360 [Solwaraspora sp. WMMA2080]WJK34231.1 hypothetical protein O7610_27060 [Solwaraspora sp. WMMA2065]
MRKIVIHLSELSDLLVVPIKIALNDLEAFAKPRRQPCARLTIDSWSSK